MILIIMMMMMMMMMKRRRRRRRWRRRRGQFPSLPVPSTTLPSPKQGIRGPGLPCPVRSTQEETVVLARQSCLSPLPAPTGHWSPLPGVEAAQEAGW
ncbi:hypothetical protein E2C01_056292 [Portunus trituberculatus]|uniref:Uncharacterized protein n=1 Tax=Portunus trituberculatus TaxID=210409 RepID=A0A5B7GXD6_PORTR|nr:hypothetical protein [Portunus trituberculatus]